MQWLRHFESMCVILQLWWSVFCSPHPRFCGVLVTGKSFREPSQCGLNPYTVWVTNTAGRDPARAQCKPSPSHSAPHPLHEPVAPTPAYTQACCRHTLLHNKHSPVAKQGLVALGNNSCARTRMRRRGCPPNQPGRCAAVRDDQSDPLTMLYAHKLVLLLVVHM